MFFCFRASAAEIDVFEGLLPSTPLRSAVVASQLFAVSTRAGFWDTGGDNLYETLP